MFLSTFFLIFFSEIADKTQLLLLAMSQRCSLWSILFGMSISCFFLNLLSISAATWLCTCIPLNDIRCIGAILFLLFGFHSLKPCKASHGHERSLPFAWLTVAIAFFLAELGDKTQLTTIAVAAQSSEKAAVFGGSFLGLIASNLFVLTIGKLILSHVPNDLLRIFSATIFFGYGSWTLFHVFAPSQLQIVLYCLFLFSLAYAYFLWQSKRASEKDTVAHKFS